MPIKVDKLDQAVGAIFEDYMDGVRDAVDTAVRDSTDVALRVVREKSPVRTGAYRRSWTKKVTRASGAIDVHNKGTVYNKKHYRLTHLLEHGHQKAGGGRVEGIPHISLAEEAAGEYLERTLARTLEEVGG